MKRMHKIALYALSLLAGVPLVLVAGVLVAANTPYGERLIEDKLPSLTGDMVHAKGLSRILPWRLTVDHATLQDHKGIWLTLEKADLRVGLLDLMRKTVHVTFLRAAKLEVARTPISSTPPEPASKKSSLPSLGVRIDELSVKEIDLGHDLVGQALSLSLSGHAFIHNIADFSAPLRFDALPVMAIGLDIQRKDQVGTIHLNAAIQRKHTDAALRFEEGAEGLVSLFGHLPALDPLSLRVDIHGPPRHLNLSMGMKAGQAPSGPLQSTISGTVDPLQRAGDLSVHVTSPHMTLRPDIGWEGINLAANLHGSMAAPAGNGTLTIQGLSVAGSGAQNIHADLGDVHQKLSLKGQIDGLRIPGKAPRLFASSPVFLEAGMQPMETLRPFSLTVKHEFLQLALSGKLSPAVSGHLALILPRLEGLAGAMGGTSLQGKTQFDADFALPETKKDNLTAQLKGALSITGGQEQAAQLIGRDGQLQLRVKRTADHAVHLEELTLNGAALHLDGQATLSGDQHLSSSLNVRLPDLSRAQSTLRGKADLAVLAQGALNDLEATVTLKSLFGMQRAGTIIKTAPLSLNAHVDHLPSYPDGGIQLTGELNRSPVQVRANFKRDTQGSLTLDLKALDWASMQGKGFVILPAGHKIPKGDLDVAIRRLDVFRPLVGKPISGHLTVGLHTQQEGQAGQKSESEQERLQLAVDGQVAMADYALRHIDLKGTLNHLPDDPYADIRLIVEGIKAQKITGNLQAQITGPQSALALTTKGDFDHILGGAAHLTMAAVENIPEKQLKLKSLKADVKGEQLQLMAPATLSYGATTGVDHLRATLQAGRSQSAMINVAGHIKPDLALEASIQHVTPELATPFVPSLKADGVLDAHAAVHGSLSAPVGQVTMDGRGLHMKTDPGASLPPASFHVQTDLHGKTAQVQAHLEAGKGALMAVQGAVPLQGDGKFGLTAKGNVDLSLANALLGASGMGVSGQLSLDMAVNGALKQPRVTGQVTMRDGSFDHYAQGVHLSGITGDVTADGDTVHIQRFLIHAGKGTMNLTGEVGALRPGLPVDLNFVMDHAQPLQSDMLEETVDSQLHIFGQATTRLDVAGKVKIPEASITIPDSMPASVSQLELISLQKEQEKKAAAPPLIIGLNVDVTSPGKLFVRGHGLFAEMQAKLNVGGTSASPAIAGGVDLRRGSFNLAGISLNFTQGRVGFDGAGVTNKIDPTVDFRADRNANGTLASLLVSGHASTPKIDFVSTPQLPRDEVLSILLFGQNRGSLSATQLAELGAAVVQITGGSAFDPLGTVRNTLGLDHLGIGGGGSVENGGSSVEAGKYVMKGVYVGAREGLSGKGAQAQVRVDLTKNLKLNTTVGTGGQVTGFTTPENDPGSSVGLSYGIDY